MAEQQQPESTQEFKQDALIEQLVPDPSQIPDIVVLVGFLGKSDRAGYVRLYLTPKLNDYFEILEKDVAHSQSLAADLNPLGGTMVWVRREAHLLHMRTEPAHAQAEFLQGDIMSHAGMGMLESLGLSHLLRKPLPASLVCTRLGITCLITQNCPPTGPFDRNCCAITQV